MVLDIEAVDYPRTITIDESGSSAPPPPPPDTTPPVVSLTAPASGAAVSGSTVPVSATASDNVGVSSVQFELDGQPLGSALTESPYTYSWNTTGVSNGTHTLTAVAKDTAGLTATATNVTVTVNNPTLPTGLTATAANSAQVNLAWSASSNATSYKIYRNGSSTALATVAAPAGSGIPPTTYTDAAVSADTTYSYTVTALNAAGTESAKSASVSVTTPKAADTTPPSVPTNLHSTATTTTSIALAWTASTDNTGGSGLAGYHLYRTTASSTTTLIASPTGTSYTDSGLLPNTTYTYSVSAYDKAANGSVASSDITVTTNTPLPPPDITPPSVPTGLTATAANSAQVNLSWTASTDNVGVTEYKLYRNGSTTALATVAAPTTSYQDAAVSANTGYSYTVTALDAAGNQSAKSTSVSVTTPSAPDKTPPSVPTGLKATATTATSVALAWNASTDNTGGSGLAGYHLYRNGTLIASPATASYTDSGLSPNTSYTYSVSAYDKAANGSVASTPLTVTTENIPTTTNPMDGNVALSLKTPGTPFASSSFWNTPLSASTPINKNSSAYVQDIVSELGSSNGNLNTARWSAPFYVVPASQALTPITLNCDSTNCSSSSTTTTLQTALKSVPLPADAVPAGGTDAHLAVYQPSTNTLWEFWRLSTPAQNAPGAGSLPWGAPSYGDRQWHAVWGGVMNNVSGSNGIFPSPYGGWTTGLPLLGSVTRIEELQAGQINHVMGIGGLGSPLSASVLPANTPGATSGISWPADRSDGTSTNALAIPEGMRFRLPANFNLTQYNNTLIANKQSPLSPVATTIAVAAQKYGFVVDASGSGSGIVGLNLGDPTPYTTAGLSNPYCTATANSICTGGIFKGYDSGGSGVMKNFPWSQLQALPFNYGEPAPNIPTGLKATATTTTSISLAWNADPSVDAGGNGLAGYHLYQINAAGQGTLIASSSGTSYTVSGLSAATSYTYSISAYDKAGNGSVASKTITVATSTPLPPPAVPTGLAAVAPSSAQVNVSWTASTGGVAAASYKLYRNGSTTALATITAPATSYQDSTVSAGTTYSYTIAALNATGTQSAKSTSVSVTTPAAVSTTPPSTPQDPSGQATGQTSITITWNPSTNTGSSGLLGYHVYRDGVLIASPTTTTYTDTGLNPGTKYTYSVSAYDSSANGSTASKVVSIKTGGSSPDTTPPTIPANLRSIQKDKTQTSITVAWNPSNDSGGSGLAGYHLYRNGKLIASPSATTYVDTGLKAGTKYTYYVRAYDNAGNVSGYRRTITVTTKHPWWQLWYLGS
jgi:fibronectin type 3 domain-containing protein